ncbi:MAG TPA: 1,2-phenylacetyl-CoA epoxidase subunit PaaD [Micromonosporaceae bacterium]|jgi:ring-1,2-phenylacetyl-CoA epoxidase subunit PaaD
MDLLTRARDVASAVPDPELPQLTLGDLGILRDVVLRDGQLSVTITPTYLGCPALDEIAADLRHRLHEAGFADVTVRLELAPAWTSDAITDEGRRKLREAGIAPPRPASPGPVPLTLALRPAEVACPRCGCADTVRTAAFGSTACKALYRCRACTEPFEYVKDT